MSSVHRHELGDLSDARIARSAEQLRPLGRARERLQNRVLAPTATYDQDFGTSHGPEGNGQVAGIASGPTQGKRATR